MDPLQKLKDVTYSLHHSPNCPSPYLIRLIGENAGRLDFLSDDKTKDKLCYGKTLAEAVAFALSQSGKSSQSKVDLRSVPAMKGLTVIRTVEDLTAFTSKLRQDSYSPEKLAVLNLESQLSDWTKHSRKGIDTFFAVHDEPDDFAKNDDWGEFTLYRVTATQVGNTVQISKEKIEEFAH